MNKTKALRAYLDECAAARAKKCALIPTRVVMQHFWEPRWKTRGYIHAWYAYHDLLTTVSDICKCSPGEVNAIVMDMISSAFVLTDEDAKIRRRTTRARD